MVESTGEASVLALIRERMLADIDLFNDILDARDTVDLQRLKLRMAAIVSGMRSPFLDNSLERINLFRHLKEIRCRARALSFTLLPDITSGETVVLLEARLAILLGLLFAECISSKLAFDVDFEMADPMGMSIEACKGSSGELGAFIMNDPFSSSLVRVLSEAGVECSMGSGIRVSWQEGPKGAARY